MKGFLFDLQLFAEEGDDGAAEGAAGAQGQTGGGAEGAAGAQAPGALNGAKDTILGAGSAPGAAGVPERYELEGAVPDGMDYDAEAAAAYSAVAKDCGLTQEQAGKLATYGMNYMQEAVAAFERQITGTIEQWGEDAKKELGADFANVTQKAAIGIEAIEKKVPNLRAALNETGAGNRIEIIRALSIVGELLGEDQNRMTGAFAPAEKNIYPNTDFSAYK